MDENRARRVADALRDRGINAHLRKAGVDAYSVQVMLPGGREAVWGAEGTTGLEAEVLLDGDLVGFIPQIPGSATFDEGQIVDAIARADYDEPEGHERAEAPPPSKPLTRDGGVFRRFLDGFRYDSELPAATRRLPKRLRAHSDRGQHARSPGTRQHRSGMTARVLPGQAQRSRTRSAASPAQGRWRRWSVLAGWAVIVSAAAIGAWRVPGAVADIRATFAHGMPGRLPWLAAAILAECVSIGASAAALGLLLDAGGVRLSRRALFGIALSYSGLASALPAGTITATVWVNDQYRRRGVPAALRAWTVVGAAFSGTVTLMGLLLAGAGVDGDGNPVLLAAAAAVLVAGSAGFVACVHRAGPGRGTGRLARWRAAVGEVAVYRAGYRRGAAVLTLSTVSWLADAAVLVVAFELVARHIPWQGLLLAYAGAQLVTFFLPVPGGMGLGRLGGGIAGVLTLTGTPLAVAAAAAITYRVLGDWLVAAAGILVSAIMTGRASARDRPGAPAAPKPAIPSP